MAASETEKSDFVFARKPKPVPGDLRISWRVSVTLLALHHSRGRQASFAKLHMLNDALRSEASKQKLVDMIEGRLPYVFWRMRVEPAFSRNLDFLVGEGLAQWKISSGRTSLELTAKGKQAAKAIDDFPEALLGERSFLSTWGKQITERFLQTVIAAGNGLK